jgi:hypothetical protein
MESKPNFSLDGSLRLMECVRQFNFMAASPGWSGDYLVGLLVPFYHNSAAVNKKIQGALAGGFINAGGFVYSESLLSKIN